MNTNTPEKYQKRQIRSFVMRTGRMTDSQKKAYEENFSRFGHTIADGAFSSTKAFGNENLCVLEIGYGMGDSLFAMAQNAPEKNFIGIEVHTPGVGRLLNLVASEGLDNLRTYAEDAVEVLDQCVADNSLSKVQIYFPDPWHKKKHNKRRIVQSEFIQQLRKKLITGGVIHLATDWQPYAEHMMEVMTAAEGFVNQQGVGNYSARPADRPETKFERRGQKLGHGVWDLLFEKAEKES